VQFVEEKTRHIIVVMLPGVYKQHIENVSLRERPHERSNLHEIRTGSADSNDPYVSILHPISHK